jgi:hypothetical protein
MDAVTAGFWNSLKTREVWPTPPGKINQPIDLGKFEKELGKRCLQPTPDPGLMGAHLGGSLWRILWRRGI